MMDIQNLRSAVISLLLASSPPIIPSGWCSTRVMSRSRLRQSARRCWAELRISSARLGSRRRLTCAKTRWSRRADSSSTTRSIWRRARLGARLICFAATGRASYYLSFAPEQNQPLDEEIEKSTLQKWFERTLLAFGARAGVVYPLDTARHDRGTRSPDRRTLFHRRQHNCAQLW